MNQFIATATLLRSFVVLMSGAMWRKHKEMDEKHHDSNYQTCNQGPKNKRFYPVARKLSRHKDSIEDIEAANSEKCVQGKGFVTSPLKLFRQ